MMADVTTVPLNSTINQWCVGVMIALTRLPPLDARPLDISASPPPLERPLNSFALGALFT